MARLLPSTVLALASLAAAGSALGEGASAADNVVVMRCAARTVLYRWPVEPALLPQRCRVAGAPAPAALAASRVAAPLPARRAATATATESDAAPAAGATLPWLVPRETQRERDAWARAIVQQELHAAEARLAQLRAQGAAEADPPRGEVLQLQRSLSALQRELTRMP